MKHTEAFNKIMDRVNAEHQAKRKLKTQKFSLIQPSQNMNDLQTSLSKCTVSGNTVRLPEEHLHNYQDVRKALLNAGAEYKRNTFVFPHEAMPYINRLMDGESVNIKKEFQAFFTPEDTADWIAANAMINHVDVRDKVLEPNGGDGALIKAMRRAGYNGVIYTYELNPIYQNILNKLPDVVLLGGDFLKADGKVKYDRIIANPPFNKNQDIDHVYKMWDVLAPKGTLISIMSKHWEFSNGKKEKQFRTWLEEKDPSIYPLDNGKFKESGTMVGSQIVVIDRD
jgi:hypothetical protein